MDEITIFLWRIIGAAIATPFLVALAIWGIRSWLKGRKS
jgi:hypothetical protein